MRISGVFSFLFNDVKMLKMICFYQIVHTKMHTKCTRKSGEEFIVEKIVSFV